MRVIGELAWPEQSSEHIAKHGVRPEEVEEVCARHPLVLRGRQGFYYALGRSDAGRYLLVVLLPRGQQWRVVTARDMDAAERRRYLRR